ncbi:hypothetical protein Tco_1175123 [Tanacetum coccineum]
MSPKRTSTSEAPAMTQAAIKNHDQAAIRKLSSEGAVGLIRWFERTGLVFSVASVTEQGLQVKFATGGPFDQELQKLRGQPLEVICYLVKVTVHACGERKGIMRTVPKKTTKQCPGKGLHAEGYDAQHDVRT